MTRSASERLRPHFRPGAFACSRFRVSVDLEPHLMRVEGFPRRRWGMFARERTDDETFAAHHLDWSVTHQMDFRTYRESRVVGQRLTTVTDGRGCILRQSAEGEPQAQ